MSGHPHDERDGLVGLDVAIRLKAELLHRICIDDASRWTKDVSRFVAALERSQLTDTTALVVLLTELREQLRLLRGIDASPFVPEAWTSLSRSEILSRFRNEIINGLPPPAAAHAPLSPIVRRAKRIIDEQFADPLTLDRLAAGVGRSKRQLATLFQQELAMTVHEYLTRVRLRRALDLIRKEEKIEVVSLLVGYRSKKNLYRQFKMRIGVTPTAYRAAIQPSRARA
jgi:AraC-like DNA-binding protein